MLSGSVTFLVAKIHYGLIGHQNNVPNIGGIILLGQADWASDQVKFRYNAILEQGPTQVSGAILIGVATISHLGEVIRANITYPLANIETCWISTTRKT